MSLYQASSEAMPALPVWLVQGCRDPKTCVV